MSEDRGMKLRKLLQTAGRFGLNPAILLIFAVVALLPVMIPNEYVVRLLVSALMMAALAMAFDFTSGFINICNFGFAAFWGLGAYTSSILVARLGVSPWAGFFFGAAASALLGVFIGVLCIRLGGIFASCMTWFVSLGMMTLANNLVKLTNGSAGVKAAYLFKTTQNSPYFYVMFGAMLLTYFLLTYLTKLNMGLAFRSIGQDIDAASSSGVNPVKYKTINFTISCALAGFIGGIYAHFIGIITPGVMSTNKTVEVMAIAYIGGQGSIWGSLVLALILVPALDLAKGLMEWRTIIYGILMILVMVRYPSGLSGLILSLRAKINKRMQRRKGDVK